MLPRPRSVFSSSRDFSHLLWHHPLFWGARGAEGFTLPLHAHSKSKIFQDQNNQVFFSHILIQFLKKLLNAQFLKGFDKELLFFSVSGSYKIIKPHIKHTSVSCVGPNQRLHYQQATHLKLQPDGTWAIMHIYYLAQGGETSNIACRPTLARVIFKIIPETVSQRWNI